MLNKINPFRCQNAQRPSKQFSVHSNRIKGFFVHSKIGIIKISRCLPNLTTVLKFPRPTNKMVRPDILALVLHEGAQVTYSD